MVPLPVIKVSIYIACLTRTLPHCTLATTKIRCHYKLPRWVGQHTSEKRVSEGEEACTVLQRQPCLREELCLFKNLFSFLFDLGFTTYWFKTIFFLKKIELSWVWCDVSKGKIKIQPSESSRTSPWMPWLLFKVISTPFFNSSDPEVSRAHCQFYFPGEETGAQRYWNGTPQNIRSGNSVSAAGWLNGWYSRQYART